VTVGHGRIQVRTGAAVDTVDITSKVVAEVRRSKIRDGLCTISVLHTTAGVFVNENADPDVQRDVLDAFERMVPSSADYRHAEGNSPGHIKSILTGSSVTIAIRDGALELGRWQGVYLAEFDGPRDRSATITCIGEIEG
jgi:secondary thiamine-phosphate synthase enzyme